MDVALAILEMDAKEIFSCGCYFCICVNARLAYCHCKFEDEPFIRVCLKPLICVMLELAIVMNYEISLQVCNHVVQ